MKRMLWLPLAVLLLALSACRSGEDAVPTAPDGAEDAAEQAAADEENTDGNVDQDDQESGDTSEAGEDSEEGTPEAAAGDEEGAEGEDGEEAVEEPTANPTVLAIAGSFEPPSKGDPDAPLIMYDFSDYT